MHNCHLLYTNQHAMSILVLQANVLPGLPFTLVSKCCFVSADGLGDCDLTLSSFSSDFVAGVSFVDVIGSSGCRNKVQIILMFATKRKKLTIAKLTTITYDLLISISLRHV